MADNFDMEKGGVKFDAGKVRMDLVPADSIFAVACVFTYGAIKYADWNWAKGMRRGRLIAALDRHKTAYLMGEEFDRESNLPHTWHMGCCTLMLISADLRHIAEEDRAKCLDAYYAAQNYFANMMTPDKAPKDDWTEGVPMPEDETAEWAQSLMHTEKKLREAEETSIFREKMTPIRNVDGVFNSARRSAPPITSVDAMLSPKIRYTEDNR